MGKTKRNSVPRHTRASPEEVARLIESEPEKKRLRWPASGLCEEQSHWRRTALEGVRGYHDA